MCFRVYEKLIAEVIHKLTFPSITQKVDGCRSDVSPRTSIILGGCSMSKTIK